MDRKDLADIEFILSMDYARSIATCVRARELMEKVVDAQPHRADLWQLYLNLELQAQKQANFKHHGGDLNVQIRGALLYRQLGTELGTACRLCTTCASTTWCTPIAQSKEAVEIYHSTLSQKAAQRRFFSYSRAGKDYWEVEWEATTRFAVHRGFELEQDEHLYKQVTF